MQTYRVLQLTDLHILQHSDDTLLGIDTGYSFRRTLQYAHQQHGRFDLILLTGDLAQAPCSASYRRIRQEIENYQTPCLCLPGNHDDSELMAQLLSGDWLSCGPQRFLGNWSIIALNSQKPNSPVGLLAERELVILEKMLSTDPKRPTLLAMHHPCVASGSPWMDTMQIENSAALLAIIERFEQIKVVVCGHIHQELSSRIKHATLLATPSTCFQFTPRSFDFDLDGLPPGYRTFELLADGQWHSQCAYLSETMPTLDRTAHGY